MTLCLIEAQKSEEREELGQCGYALTIEWEVGRRDRRRGDQAKSGRKGSVLNPECIRELPGEL